ncbi:MAG: RAMP superfamily CRISPR-associated protein [Abditibacteriales bacterium]|nr:RAMP superfamily CRISPR-associated protein [Abditibacteriales bacterium]MDW8366250.1 RAMP superfamily CRISPR-associated protein [Abditibacteriales bacterium]
MMRREEQRGGWQPPLPKPYAFVPLPDERSDLRQPPGHDRYTQLSGRIEGIITALSPVHIASGNIELTGRQPSLVKAHFRCGGKPTIPGSSLKGAMRSITEAISNPPSCARITKARFDSLPRVASPCRDKEKLCLACRLFGAMSYLGRVRFRDASLLEGATEIVTIPSLFAPRARERVYFTGRRMRGRKFYKHGLADGAPARGNVPIEVCPKGSQFGLQVDFENLSRDELGLLLVALGQGDPPLFPKFGGGKPACCGSVRIEVASVRIFPAAAMEFDAEPTTEDVRALVSQMRLVHRGNYDALREVLRFPGEERCPDRNY